MRLRCATCSCYVKREQVYRRNTVSSWCSRECFDASRQQSLSRRLQSTEPPKKQRSLRNTRSQIPAPIREQVLRRDQWACRWCGGRRNERLNIHHIRYLSEGVDHSPHNLITLHEACHTLMHSRKRVYKPILLGVIWLEYVESRHVLGVSLQRRLAISTT